MPTTSPRTHQAAPAVGCTLVALLLALAGVASVTPGEHSAVQAYSPAGIDNLIAVSASILCGAEPQGESAFAALRQRGVRTIVSVDGAVPDVETARQQGLRYVHIPIGYDGLPDEAARKLTRVLQDCERPVFIHCHHGKHRGPAAAAVTAIAAGELDHPQAIALLEAAGTSHDYAGLWRDVANFTPLPPHTSLPPLVETIPPEPLVDVMVRIDHCFDQLVDAAGSEGQPQRNNSESSSTRRTVELAVLLQERFHEASRLQHGEWPKDMQQSMLAAEQAASELAHAFRDLPAATPARLQRLRDTCHDCHQHHRN